MSCRAAEGRSTARLGQRTATWQLVRGGGLCCAPFLRGWRGQVCPAVDAMAFSGVGCFRAHGHDCGTVVVVVVVGGTGVVFSICTVRVLRFAVC